MTPTSRITLRRPAPLLKPILYTLAHGDHRGLYPSPISRRPQPDHHPTLGTTIALEKHTSAACLIKVRFDIPVPPNPVALTLRTSLGPLPAILAPQLHQPLDAHFHKEYQELCLSDGRGFAPPRREGRPLKPCPSLPSSFPPPENKKPPFGGSE